MPTNDQLRTIHKAARAVGLIKGPDDARYRMLLRNVGNVTSSKDLDNAGVEDVMAVLEDMGFDRHPGGRTYWRDKVRLRGCTAGERMAHKIHALARAEGQRYELGALCERFSQGRTDRPEDLLPREAWMLIEMLKGATAREQARARGVRPRQPSLFG